MAIKKSELYSSLWASCDELRGSMDASQYKDYVLVMLFMKYVSDRVKKEKAEGKHSLISIPAMGGFYDMLQFRGKAEIGDKINKIIGEFAKANNLNGIITEADFNDDGKLGDGKAKVDRLTNLLNIFNNPKLDFSGNRAEGDDLLGDAYEYLMRNFATESGKSKGQFYTPAEVSRIMAQVIQIDRSKSQDETLCDPACGSGSLLLKAASLAPHGITIYGQEYDHATRALAVMNMWLHHFADADIKQGNSLADPQLLDDKTGGLKTFDFAVANPPFSYKSWMNGLDSVNDIYERFEGYSAVPPAKNGDYAFLLHLLKSLKSTGIGCIVMPLGVLFRGNAEATIRKGIIERGYIEGIIGLPPNLFFGTGIAASLLVLDKANAGKRDSIFMMDASKGFIKDGNKNRLRERDIRQIVDAYKNRLEIPGYSRNIPLTEIKDTKNDYNLNIPRYIDSQEPEDIQDIAAHLLGGIPKRDIDSMENYWEVYPTLKNNLFKTLHKRPGFYQLQAANEEIKSIIYNHPEFISFSKQMDKVFTQWKNKTIDYAWRLDKDLHPKTDIQKISETLLKTYEPYSGYSAHHTPLIDKYAMYQHLMDYWAETMQDDFYELAADGWKAGNEVIRLEKTTKKGDKETVKQVEGIEGLTGRLIPPALMIQEYFGKEQSVIDTLQSQAETLNANMEELREEQGGEDGLLANAMDDKGKISKANLTKAIREVEPAPKALPKIKRSLSMAAESGKSGVKHVVDDSEVVYGYGKDTETEGELQMLQWYKKLMDEEADIQVKIKVARTDVENKVVAKYPKLSIAEIKRVVIEKKWMADIEQRIHAEMDNISHRLTQRIKELAERYETPLPEQAMKVSALEEKVNHHLQEMGYVWK